MAKTGFNESQTSEGSDSAGGAAPSMRAAPYSESALNRIRDGLARNPDTVSIGDGSIGLPEAIDVYKTLRPLGEGAMGTVLVAHDTELNRDIAIKALRPGFSPESAARLRLEATSLARLNHANVVTVHRLLECNGRYYLVMELLTGSLKGRSGSWREVTGFIRDAAAGLAAAHEAGLVHRDIKPSNLLLRDQGNDKVIVKIADFGLVQTIDVTVAQLTASDHTVGTPTYMAPEQWQREADFRSDVYSLGCTYYHLLTGRPPFEGKAASELRSKHLNEPIPDPRQYASDLPDEVRQVITTACEKKPELRYQNAREMLADLEAILNPPQVEVLHANKKVRFFISCPDDVKEERVRATNVILRLSDQFSNRLLIEPVFHGRPGECEFFVCVLWSQLGNATEIELDDAAKGSNFGQPDLLVYHKTASALVSLNDDVTLERRRSERKLVDSFVHDRFMQGTDKRQRDAFRTFETSGDFEQLLERELLKLIGRRLPKENAAAFPPKPSWTDGSPFRGLHVFEFEHAAVFFGRTRAVGDLLTALRVNSAQGRSFLLVVGISGGGKSSLVRAGLLPLLVEPGVIDGVVVWRRALMRPADEGDPIQSIAASLLAPEACPELGVNGTNVVELANLIRLNPIVAAALVKGALGQAAASMAREQSLAQPPEVRLVLVADQLEELFTLAELKPSDRQVFVAILSALARSGKVWVVATLRGDFYHRCFDLPDLVALQEGSGQYALPLPTPAEITQMIRHPARAAGLSFEEDPATGVPLDEVLREAAASGPECLPLLEFALDELYKRRTKTGLLTYAAYRDLGGVEGALALRAEEAFEEVVKLLGNSALESLDLVFRAMVTVGLGESAFTRDRAPLKTLSAAGASKLVDAFVSRRLFIANTGENRQPMVYFAHEALIRSWPRCREWVEMNRRFLRIRARVREAATEWIERGQSPDFLLSAGAPLNEARDLLAKHRASLGPEVAEFITKSAAESAASSLRQRRRERIRWGVAALAVFAIAGALIGAIWFRQVLQRKSRDEAIEFETNGDFALNHNHAADAVPLYREFLRRMDRLGAPGSSDKAFQLKYAKGCIKAARAMADDARTLDEAKELADKGMRIEIAAEGHLELGYDNATDFSLESDKLAKRLDAAGENKMARRLYSRELDIDQQLLAQSSDDSTRQDVANDMDALAGLSEDTDETMKLRSQEIELRRTIVRNAPGDSLEAYRLALTIVQLGDLQVANSRYEEAMGSYRQSAMKIGNLLTWAGADADWKYELAVVHADIGRALRFMGKYTDATSEYRESCRITEELDPSTDQSQGRLADRYSSLAFHLAFVGKCGESLRLRMKVESIRAALLKRVPDDPARTDELCTAQSATGAALWRNGDISAAEAKYRAVFNVRQKVLETLKAKKAMPTITQRRAVAAAECDVADALRFRGRLVEARNLNLEALEVRKQAFGGQPDPAKGTSKTFDLQGELADSLAVSGTVSVAQGDLHRAVQLYESSRKAREDLVKKDASNVDRSMSLSFSLDSLGDVALSQGHSAEARTFYSQTLQSRQASLSLLPENLFWQANLCLVQNDLARIDWLHGSLGAAMKGYEGTVASFRRQVQLDPDYAWGLCNLASSLERVSSIYSALGQCDEAAQASEEALKLRSSVLERDPQNSTFRFWQASSRATVADVLLFAGRRREALGACSAAVEEFQRLTTKDLSNATWKSASASATAAMGDLKLREGDIKASTAFLASAAAARDQLSELDPSNFTWRSDVASSQDLLAQALLNDAGKTSEALAASQRAVEIRKSLFGLDPTNCLNKRRYAANLGTLSRALTGSGEIDGAVGVARDSYAMLVDLTRQDPVNLDWQEALAESCVTLANALLDTRRVAFTDEARRYLDQATVLVTVIRSAIGDDAVLLSHRIEIVRNALSKESP